MRRACGGAVAVAVLLLAGCGPGGGGAPAPESGTLIVDSPQITAGRFTVELTCDGLQTPPQVRWAPLDTRTQSVVVEMLDPDAPGGTFTHWLLYQDGKVDTTATRGWVGGTNDFGTTGYRGPCPPAGQTHGYHIVVIELESPLSSGAHPLAHGFKRADVEAAVAARTVLRQGELVATYGH